MLPAPRQKQPQISPIFISDKVTLHVSREKDKKKALGRCRMGRYEGPSTGRLGAGPQGLKGESHPAGRGRDDPPLKNWDPLRSPLGFSS
jgi:hypothetical protein